MYRTLRTRILRLTVASLGGLILISPAGLLGPISSASAAVSPAIDRSFAAPTANADPDPFYTPPATLPTGNPGDIIRARPSLAGPPTARSLADAWQVMYLSTDAQGNPDAVTGTILVPKAIDRTQAPVVGFAPGTTGPAFRCTVSRFINTGAFYEQPAVNDMLAAGDAVAIPDYEGYHQNPTTTYIVGRSMGPALLDIVRAATRLPEAGLSSNPKVLLRGYSQGGGAAMWGGQFQPTYAPELNLIGVAGGGVPADLIQVSLQLESKGPFGFFLTAIAGLDQAYPDLLLGNYLNDTGKAAIANSNANDCTVELLLNYNGVDTDTYLADSPFVVPAWLQHLAENKLGGTKITVPVFDYSGTSDEIVQFKQAKALRDTYCAMGMTVDWRTYPVGHITGVSRGNPDVSAFLADRIAGKPAVSNCGT